MKTDALERFSTVNGWQKIPAFSKVQHVFVSMIVISVIKRSDARQENLAINFRRLDHIPEASIAERIKRDRVGNILCVRLRGFEIGNETPNVIR